MRDQHIASNVLKASANEGPGSLWATHNVIALPIQGRSHGVFSKKIVPRIEKLGQRAASGEDKQPPGCRESGYASKRQQRAELSRTSGGPIPRITDTRPAKRPRNEGHEVGMNGNNTTLVLSSSASVTKYSRTPSAVPESAEWMRAQIIQLESDLESARAARDLAVSEQHVVRIAHQAQQQARREAMVQKSAAEAAQSRAEAEQMRLESELKSIVSKKSRLSREEDSSDPLGSVEHTKVLERDLEEMRHRQRKDQLRMSKLESELEQAKAEIDRLKSDLASAQERQDSTQQSLESLQRKYSSTSRKYESSKERLGIYKSRLENERSIVKKLQETLTPAAYKSLGATHETLGAFLSAMGLPPGLLCFLEHWAVYSGWRLAPGVSGDARLRLLDIVWFRSLSLFSFLLHWAALETTNLRPRLQPAMPRASISRLALSKRAPTCASGAPTWWNNAQGATPCEVYQSVLDACGYTVPSISNNESYYPVTVAQLCMCNTVAYNLGSACQDCQRGSTDQGILFSLYTAGGDGCVAPITSLPTSVNPAQQIPEWALQDTSALFWSYAGAQSIANSTATTTASTTSTITSAHTMEPTETLTLSDPAASHPAETATPLPASKSINAGAIGGGVAGGVVFLLLVIGLLLFLRRRRAQKSLGKPDTGMGAIGARNGSTSSESSLTESGKASGSTSHYTPHSQMAQLNHSSGSGTIVPSSHSTSALTTPVDAPPVPSIPYEYTSSTIPSRSQATSPTPSAPGVQKVKRVPVRYSEDELARAEEENRKATALSSSPPR
ncbi:hypothetical protein OPQ81_007212 [Rhizoctonia solani]|nr:hypothetical protein OPQ81_007212 [Rhizoctonia solani]